MISVQMDVYITENYKYIYEFRRKTLTNTF